MSTVYGYCRISRKTQKIDRQIRNISEAYNGQQIHFVTEAYTGTTTDRPEWNKLYKAVKDGDTIVFDSVSRMSRNADEGFNAYEELFNRGVNLVFLKEPHISTDTYKSAMKNAIPLTGTNIDYILKGVNQYLLELVKEQIKIAFEQSQKEVDDLHQRTAEGIMTARLNGKQIGNKMGSHRETKKGAQIREAIKKYSRDFGGTLIDEDVMKLIGASRNTYYKYKRMLKTA